MSIFPLTTSHWLLPFATFIISPPLKAFWFHFCSTFAWYFMKAIEYYKRLKTAAAERERKDGKKSFTWMEESFKPFGKGDKLSRNWEVYRRLMVWTCYDDTADYVVVALNKLEAWLTWKGSKTRWNKLFREHMLKIGVTRVKLRAFDFSLRNLDGTKHFQVHCGHQTEKITIIERILCEIN